MAAERIRGQEDSVRIVIDGVPMTGSWTKVMDFEETPQDEIIRTGFAGEATDDIDENHNGYDVSWTMQVLDSKLMDFQDEKARRHEAHLAPQVVEVQRLTSFRDVPGGDRGRIRTYFNGSLKIDSDGWRARKDYHEVKVSGSFQSRKLRQR